LSKKVGSEKKIKMNTICVLDLILTENWNGFPRSVVTKKALNKNLNFLTVFVILATANCFKLLAKINVFFLKILIKKCVAWPQVNFLWTFWKYKAFIQKILLRNWNTYQLCWFQKIKTYSDWDTNQNDFKLTLSSLQILQEIYNFHLNFIY
jgi:hypothetical protein